MWWIAGGVAYLLALSFGTLFFCAGKRADEQLRTLSPKFRTSPPQRITRASSSR